MINIGAYIAIAIVVMGYLYGKIINNLIKPMSKINCTIFGILLIFSIFQIATFVGMNFNLNYEFYVYTIILCIFLPFILIVIFRVNILPNVDNLISLLCGLLFVLILTNISLKQNTNNTFYDSIYYLSKVIESSFQDHMGYITNYSGAELARLDVFYDYQGFYYFWGVILRTYREYFEVSESLTPIYIWGASFVYYYSLGTSIGTFLRYIFKRKISLLYLAFIAILLPYYTNYFNTTLAFFGNTIRTIGTACLMFLVYLFIKKQDSKILYLAFFVNLACMCFTSTSLFINVFIFLALTMYYVFIGEKNYKIYRDIVIAILPLVYYASVVLSGWQYNMPKVAILIYAFVVIMLIVLQVLIKFSNEKLDRIIINFLRICFVLSLGVLIFVSFKIGFNFDYYFSLKSKDDMLLNFVNYEDKLELYRNIVLYGILLVYLFQRRDNSFKVLLLIVLIYFLNPLTMSAIVKYLTSEAYHRVFEILVNPFTLIVFAYYSSSFMRKWLKYLVFIPIGLFSFYLFYIKPDLPMLSKNDEGYNNEIKVTDSLYDMYKYINENIIEEGERPVFLSQDFGIKGYVSDIIVKLTTIDYRNAIAADFDENDKKQELINYFYPYRQWETESPFGVTPDYENVCKLFDNDVDYILMKNNIPVPFKEIYFVNSWEYAKGCTELVYKNDYWVLLRNSKTFGGSNE